MIEDIERGLPVDEAGGAPRLPLWAHLRYDVCDAHPEIGRIARNIGELTRRDCPVCSHEKLRRVNFVYGRELAENNGRAYPLEQIFNGFKRPLPRFHLLRRGGLRLLPVEPLAGKHPCQQPIEGGVLMCESHAFLLRDGKEELVLEDVVTVRENEGEVYLASIIGEEKTLHAEVSEINLLNHRILLTPLS